jgi:hypothetical protein
MSDGRSPTFRLKWLHVLLVVALPAACATGTEPDLATGDALGAAGTTAEAGTDSGGSSASTAGNTSIAGTTVNEAGKGSSSGGSGGGTSDGGKSSGGGATGGKGGAGSTSGAGGKGDAGSTSGGAGSTSGGAGRGGAGGSGGTAAGGSGGSGGSATGPCACTKKTHTWADNVNLVGALASGDCFDVDGDTFVYTGTASANFYQNKDCKPGDQLSWCPGGGYQFMACP